MGQRWIRRLLGLMVILVLLSVGFSYGPTARSGSGTTTLTADDSNGDTHSGCHTGAKGRGAGGNDKGGGGCDGGTT